MCLRKLLASSSRSAAVGSSVVGPVVGRGLLVVKACPLVVKNCQQGLARDGMA